MTNKCMEKEMNIIKYLEKQKIDYVYIQLDNKKTFIPKRKVDKDNMFFYINDKNEEANMNNAPIEIFKHSNRKELIAENHRLYSDNNAIAIDTSNTIWADIDIRNEDELNKLTETGQQIIKTLISNFPNHSSNKKSLGSHSYICKKDEIKLSNPIRETFKNYTGNNISDYSQFKKDIDNSVKEDLYTKINSECACVEIFCGMPLWCLKDKVMKKSNKAVGGQKAQNVLAQILHNDFIEKYRDRTKEELKKEKKEQESKIKKEQQKKQLEEIKIDENYINDRQDLILQLTKLINTDLYLEVSSTFHNIVWSLSYNNCNSSLEYIKSIGRNSSKCDKQIKYDTYFDNLVEKGKNKYQLNIGVIYNLARQSNQKRYIELITQTSSSISNKTLAEVFMKSYEGDIILLRLDPKSPDTTWFYNKEKNIWSCEDACNFKTLLNIINKFCIEYIMKVQEVNDVDYTKTIDKFMDSLEQANKVKNFIISELIIEPKTIKFDNKPHLIPFKNKIFNTKTCKFEDHKRDNYITLVLDYDFRTINENEPEYINAKNYFEELFLWKENGEVIEEHSHRDIMNDVLYIISNCFIGRDMGEHFYIFNGRGGNGKSKLFDLLRMILDKNKYYGGCNGNLLCNEIDPHKPSPDIANLQNKRVNVLQEPSENKLLNISAIKYLTGETEIRARKLFKNPEDFALNATNILVCNQRLGFEGRVNDAMIRRIIDIYLPFVFSNNKINKKKKIYKPKAHLNLEDIKMGFINYIFNYMINFEAKYKKNINYIDYKFSNTTMERTKNYLLEYDYFGQFLDSYIIRTENVNNCITMKEIHNDFKKSYWYKDLDDKKKSNFDNFDKFKKNILEVEEYKDIQYDDSKNKKGWKFIYCVKNNDYKNKEDELLMSDEEEDNNSSNSSFSNCNIIDSNDSDDDTHSRDSDDDDYDYKYMNE